MPNPLTNWPALHADHFQCVRVLVTGAAGFIGSHLCEALADLGANVVALDDLNPLSNSSLANLSHVHLDQFLHASILDKPALEHATKNCHYVFHQAALGSVPGSIDHPALYHETNATGTLNVLQAARNANVKRLTFAASSSAYGDSPTLPKSESMPTSALSPYAASKIAAESLLSAYAHAYNLDTVSLRYFNVFGPRQSPNNAYAAVIAAFAKSLLNNQSPAIYGDGSQSRDFTFVHNAVHANLLAARSPNPLHGQPINVACAQAVSINQLAQTMSQLLDKPRLTPQHKPPRPGDVKHSLADLTLAKKLLGYTPIVDFLPGLKITLDWYRQSLPAEH